MVATAQAEMADEETMDHCQNRQINARLVSPWLITTKWHEHVAGYHIGTLIQLVATPKKDEFPGLKKLVFNYMSSATGSIKSTAELVLQTLNTPDPAKTGINNTPFHAMQQDETLSNYSGYVVQLIAFLLRPKGQYSLPLSSGLTVALEQLQLWIANAVHDEDEDGYTELHNVLSQLWMNKWLPAEDNHIPCPTVRFLALLTLKPDGSHKDPHQVTPTIARLVYCMRLFFLAHIKAIAQQSYHGDEEIACKAASRWFTEKVESPFNALRSLQHRASAMAYKTSSQPRVYWLDRTGYTSMLYRGTKITQQDLQTIFTRMEKTAIELWERDILCGMKVDWVDWSNIVDDLVNTDVGYCFLTDRRNHTFGNHDILLGTIMDNAAARETLLMKTNYGDGWEWNKDFIRLWLSNYAIFEGILLARCEMLSGAPARGTEITSMTFRNTLTRTARNLVAYGPYLSIVTLYHKTGGLTGSDRLLPHALDALTADLIIQNLAVARPFAQFLVHLLHHGEADVKKLYQEQLFVNNCKLFDTQDLSNIMARFTLPVLGIELGVNAWRHVSTSWKRKHCAEMYELAEEDMQESADIAQAGHTSNTENRIYGLSQFALATLPEDFIPLFLDASTRWHIACKVVPGSVILPYQQVTAAHFADYAPATNPNPPLPSKDFLHNLAQLLLPILQPSTPPVSQSTTVQASSSSDMLSHGTDTTAIVPTNNMVVNTSDHASDHFSVFPIDQNIQAPDMRVLQLPSTSAAHAPVRLALNGHTSSPVDHQPLAVPSMQQALQCLRHLLRKPQAGWSCAAQREGLEAVLKRESDVLAVMATGSGKSMLMIIPPLLEDAITVGVLPLRSLMDDYERKLQAMGIQYQVFDGDSGSISTQTNLVLVSVDHARMDSWRQALAEASQQRSVARMVIDEGHYAITSDDFRDCMREIYEVRQISMQLVVLSATVPPLSQPTLVDAFGLMQDNMIVIRTPTIRPEIQYHLNPPAPMPAVHRHVKAILESYVHKFTAQDRVLIYVPFRTEGEALSTLLHCEFYHGKLDPLERLKMRDRWLAGTHNVMVCTEAYGAGNDYPHVRLVIHAGSPRSMTNYAQEAGRAGRDCQRAICIVLPHQGHRAPSLVAGKIDHQGQQAMFEWLGSISSQICLRQGISRFTDGSGLTCHEYNCAGSPCVELCSICQQPPPLPAAVWPQPSPPAPMLAPAKRPAPPAASPFDSAAADVKKRRIENITRIGGKTERIFQALEFFGPGCVLCRFFSKQDRPKHQAIYDCPVFQDPSNHLTTVAAKAMKTGLNYDRAIHGSVCFKCHVPQLNDTLHASFQKKSSDACTHRDVMLPLAFWIISQPPLRQQVLKEHGVADTSVDSFKHWLKCQSSTEYPTNLTNVLIWYHAYCQQQHGFKSNACK
ncbi:hypothetical protein GLOTRDRAFT_134134 [Gloeophyllum trabeum ATCC 11539]|uniref:DNA 3'-5' helicase n=1 Tax=Gloeophyllum trabeum (strain ATCC 11539 / FP-39264 / Madison 617) TaxID=670483 RepID=S7PS59_GLOTA|nr:uncharacterized protein GLOTRDRAFT_134134 [Gloeophyllum trabeum ATCC 11539]EPQ50228.1 hypothetical protein GLOTRDRAFT_134134 [Gloeophyllum trabeum ATCC 11539]